MTFLVYGGLHLYLHVLRCQGTEFQFDTRPFATRNPAFLFGDQVRDKHVLTLASGVTVWTAYEVVTLWAFANGLLPFADARGDSPWFVGLWFVAVVVLAPLIHHLHFDFTHRLLHWRPVYRSVHYLHHRNVNTGPWVRSRDASSGNTSCSSRPCSSSGWSRCIRYMSCSSFRSRRSGRRWGIAASDGFGSATEGGLTLASNFHSVHHRRFKYNYGGSLVPLDKWLGTYHDDSDTARSAQVRQGSTEGSTARAPVV